ncbi:hypothetical protein HPB50_000672 [Hyalomma asiaticum]|uniref:Uncharacterized protein n=1 Tax=Hyalomma asiaticum TaxID=266040 RepID=A0ACB7T9L5_HYAAI|nr:hypothetical protein HPB50_000672 [Hyalomma asiaticum]
MARTTTVFHNSWLSWKHDVVGADKIPLECTRGPTRFCGLLRHLRACNEILWNAGLQIRDHRSELGNLSVTTVPGVCSGFPDCDIQVHDKRKAVDLLRCLFKVHRCIVAVKIKCGTEITGMLVRALSPLKSLRVLEVSGIVNDQPEEPRPWQHVSARFWAAEDCDETLVDKTDFPMLLLSTSDPPLVTLDVAALRMSQATATKLIEALTKNTTIRELAVGAVVFTPSEPGGAHLLFLQYLAKENVALRKLVLKACDFKSAARVYTLVQALSSMTTLEELDAEWTATSQHFMLLSRLVTNCRSLRCLRFAGRDRGRFAPDIPLTIDASSVIFWKLALEENSVLEKLVLDIPWSSAEDSCMLIRSLSRNHSLQSLTLCGLPHDGGLREVCSTIRDCRVGQRVLIGDYNVGPRDVSELSRCQELTCVTVDSEDFDDASILLSSFDVLLSCNHITSLRVHLALCGDDVCTSLSACVKGASHIKELQLLIVFDNTVNRDNDQSHPTSDLCEALASNHGLTKIELSFSVELAEDDCKTLVNACLNNRSLYELSVRFSEGPRAAFFMSHLLPHLKQNYRLLRLELSLCAIPNAEMLAAQDITRRNCSLVERATAFVLGDHDAYCARAIELVSAHPKLFDNVRRKVMAASVDAEAKAAAMIRRALRLPCLVEMNGFMKLAGVVRERVVRGTANDGGGLHLSELKRDCWLHIRQYLKLSDVVEP